MTQHLPTPHGSQDDQGALADILENWNDHTLPYDEQLARAVSQICEIVARTPILEPAQGWSNNHKDIYVKAQVQMRKRIVGKLKITKGE